MQFSIPFSAQDLPALACIEAGQRALTTALLGHSHVFDFSRLSLLGLTFEVTDSEFPAEIMVQTAISEMSQRETGKHFVVSVSWAGAKVDFEIVDRKRGLEGSLLHCLHEPTKRAPADSSSKELLIQDLAGSFESLEWMMAELLKNGNGHQGQFLFFGSLDPKLPAKLVLSPEIVEILQSDVLIAQLIQNYVL